jgi:inner membrane protein
LDNLCHTLVGAALGEAGLARRKPLATATLLIGANLPDVDGLTYAFLDGPTSLAFRRGWTHGVLAMAVLPVLLAAAMVGWDQMVRRRQPGKSRGQALRACTRRSSRIPARFRALLLPAFASVLSHPVLDFLNTYGVRFLYPFSGRWFYGDTLFILDVWVWIALVVGLALSRLQRRRRSPRPEIPARASLVAVAAYAAVMMASSFVGRGIVRRSAVAAGLTPNGRVLVAPLPLVPTRRMALVEEPGGYRFGELRWTPRPVVSLSDRLRPVNQNDPAVAAAKRTLPFRRFLVWARFPYYHVRRKGALAVVEARDGRYPGRAGSWAAVSAVIRMNPTDGDVSTPRLREPAGHRTRGADAATIVRMRSTRIAPLALAGVLAVVSPAPAASRSVFPWIEDDYGKAIAQARARNVPIFVEAWAPW